MKVWTTGLIETHSAATPSDHAAVFGREIQVDEALTIFNSRTLALQRVSQRGGAAQQQDVESRGTPP